MIRPATRLAGLVPVVALVLGCSGLVTSTNPPTPSPTPSLVPIDPVPPSPEPTDTAAPTAPPTASPSPAPTSAPDPTPVPWVEIETELLMLELRGENLPIETDDMGDGLNADGSEQRDMSPDLDLRRSFGGWAPLDQSKFGKGGFFDCADPNVLCGNNPQPIGGNKLALIGLQTYGDIDTDVQRDGQLAVCFNRLGQTKAPDGSGSFGGCDLVVIADLTSGNMFELVYNGQFQARDTIGRAHIDGDTALFVMPLGMGEEPGYRVVTFERIPPQTSGGGRTDTLPSGDWNVDSFFDIFYEIPAVN
jgi:hypothetical protein